MKTVSCCFTIFLVTTIHATPVIYSLQFFIVFNSLSIDFLAFNSGHGYESQPVLGLVVQ